MDGNGRWARRRSLPRTAGHTEGEENLAAVVRTGGEARRRLVDRVRVLDRELGAAAGGGAPHPRAAQEAVRPSRRAQRSQRARAVDRPAVRQPRGAHAPLRPEGDPEGRSPTRPATPEWSSPWRSTTAVVPRSSTPPRTPPSMAAGRITADDLDGPCTFPSCPRRRGRAHVRRATNLELPALAVRRLARVLHRADLARLRRRRTGRRNRHRSRLTARPAIARVLPHGTCIVPSGNTSRSCR